MTRLLLKAPQNCPEVLSGNRLQSGRYNALNNDSRTVRQKEADMEEEFRQRVIEALKDGTIEGDGHTLYSPERYAPFFSEAELEEAGLIETHKSDGTAKGSIFAPDGSLIPELKAVYNLEFLYWLARKVGVTQSVRSMGRGSQAQELVGYIHDAVLTVAEEAV